MSKLNNAGIELAKANLNVVKMDQAFKLAIEEKQQAVESLVHSVTSELGKHMSHYEEYVTITAEKYAVAKTAADIAYEDYVQAKNVAEAASNELQTVIYELLGEKSEVITEISK